MLNYIESNTLNAILSFLTIDEQLNFTPNRSLTALSRTFLLEKNCEQLSNQEYKKYEIWLTRFLINVLRFKTSYQANMYFNPLKGLKYGGFLNTSLKKISLLINGFKNKAYPIDFIRKTKLYLLIGHLFPQ